MSDTQTLPTADELKQASVSELATIIRKNWPKVNYAAQPYLDAMRSMDSFDQDYGADTGQSIGLYFLSNASSWRGDVAKLVRAELKRRLKIK